VRFDTLIFETRKLLLLLSAVLLVLISSQFITAKTAFHRCTFPFCTFCASLHVKTSPAPS